MGNDNSKIALENQQMILQLQHQLNSRQHESKPRTLFEILKNKKLMQEIEKNPITKRKLLEKLLKEHKHVMTNSQIQRINNILDNLPINTQTNNNYNDVDDVIPLSNVESSIAALSNHYKNEIELENQLKREQAEYKFEEERRKKEFEEKQRKRRLQYQSYLQELDKKHLDALKLFNLTATYTLDELKAAYRKLAIKTHPDKVGGDADKFEIVTKYYMLLLEKHKNRESDKSFTDLKNDSKSFQTNAQPAAIIDKDKFDIKMFNKIYEENKLWDSSDDGYGKWFSSNDTEEPPTELFGKKFNLNVFNSTFENYKNKLTEQSGAIQTYQIPQELVSTSANFTDIDIYARKITDFSKPAPITGKSNNNNLCYTDLKTAYTSQGAFIDPKRVEYKTYNSVDELKRDRSAPCIMTKEQEYAYELKKQQELQNEHSRIELIRQRDTLVSDVYTKTHLKMLGYHPTSK